MNWPMDYIDKIIEGKCLEIIKGIPDKAIDMILADLPYGVSGCKWDIPIPLDELWLAYKRIIRDDGAIVLTATQPFSSLLIMSNLEMFRYRWIWDKLRGGNFQLAKLQPMNTVEDVCVFSKARCANGAKLNMRYFPIKTPRDKPVRAGGKPSTTDLLHSNNMVALHNEYHDKYPTSILTFEKPTGKDRVHPTQKPVKLFEYLIQTYTKPGEIVLDNVIGSGTTAIACINTDRHFVGIDSDKNWCNIASNRVWFIQKELINESITTGSNLGYY